MPPGAELTAWLEGIDGRTRARLARYGLLDRQRAGAGKALAEHLGDFMAALTAKGNTARHVAMTGSMVRALLDGCGFEYLSDVDAARVLSFLAECRRPKGEDDRGMGIETGNHYLRAFKSFFRWLVRERRASESPVAHLSVMNSATDRRRVRRALSAEECGKLLAATAESCERREGMAGRDRAMLYRLALESGLRWSELRSLTAGSFRFDAIPPSVTVRAACAKNRREDMLPLRMETAGMLAEYLRGKLPHVPAFPMPKRNRGGAMLQADLAKAGIEADTDAGTIDFMRCDTAS